MRFSIIIPVYNLENYIESCLDSILNQTFTDYEVIIVNDGSNDASEAICNGYKELLQNFKLINQKNKGLSVARNEGLEIAEGDYILFVDGDDYIDQDSLGRIHELLVQAENPEMLVTKIKEVTDEEIHFVDEAIHLEEAESKNELLLALCVQSLSVWPSVRYITRRDAVQKYHLRFKKNYLHEDIHWTANLLLRSDNIVGSDLYWYNHRMERIGAITRTVNVKRTLDILKIAQEVMGYDFEVREVRKIVCTRIVESFLYSLMQWELYSTDDRIRIIHALKQEKSMNKYTRKISHRVFLAACQLFGYSVVLDSVMVLRKIVRK